jgi:hypothetical protein
MRNFEYRMGIVALILLILLAILTSLLAFDYSLKWYNPTNETNEIGYFIATALCFNGVIIGIFNLIVYLLGKKFPRDFNNP